MTSWLIGVVTGLMYDLIRIAARLKPEDEARRLKARWALSLGVWNSGGADEYYLGELDRFFREDRTVLVTLEESLPEQSASFLVQRKKVCCPVFALLSSRTHRPIDDHQSTCERKKDDHCEAPGLVKRELNLFDI